MDEDVGDDAFQVVAVDDTCDILVEEAAAAVQRLGRQSLTWTTTVSSFGAVVVAVGSAAAAVVVVAALELEYAAVLVHCNCLSCSPPLQVMLLLPLALLLLPRHSCCK